MKGISKRIHFMGIGGSGMSAVAAIAKSRGFVVSGCDLENTTAYFTKLKELGIKIYKGHDRKHLDNYDLLVITPAIIYQNSKNPEYLRALSENKVIVWNKFVGDYLLEGKKVIAVSGTHGKGTVTAMTSLIFEEAKLDPGVLIGATVKEWNSNYRIGKGNVFIIEADEFYEKFLDYKPSTIIINNIEFDHPDYFKSESEIINSFKKFISKLDSKGSLVVNLDSDGVVRLLKSFGKKRLEKFNLYGYSLLPNPNYLTDKIINASVTKQCPEYTQFTVYSKSMEIDEIYKLKLPGEYNVSNALGAIVASKLYGIETSIIKEQLLNFSGLIRRFELLGEKNNITVYDDYAHHPTAIRQTLQALRQRYPTSRIWAINEPHSFSRTKALLSEYKGSFDFADNVIIGPIFKARDSKTYGVSGNSIIKIAGHKNSHYYQRFSSIIKVLKANLRNGDVVIVMGAGKSYLWAREILGAL